MAKTPAAPEKQTSEKRIGAGKAGPGRPKGVPNKNTTQLKEAILEAATIAGGKDGLVGYLTNLARSNETAFAGLLGKVLPMTLAGTGADGAVVHRIELVGVSPK